MIGKNGTQPDPDFVLLTSVARLVPDSASAQAAMAAGIDWDRFTALAIGHRIPALAYRGLRECGLKPRAPALDRLAAAAKRAGLRSLVQARETVMLARAFRDSGIGVLFLKGAVEGAATWKDPSLRHAGDIDFFVVPADARRAAEMLLAQGFLPVMPELMGVLGSLRLRSPEVSFRRPNTNASDTDVLVELHWGFTTPTALFPVPVEAMLARAVPVAIGGAEVPTLPFPERLLYLCAHGGGHGWTRLSWLCDVAEGLRSADTVGKTATLAAEFGLTRLLTVSCHLAHQVLSAPLPAWCGTETSGERRLVAGWSRSLTFVPDADAARGYRPRWRKFRTDLALRTGWRGKAAMAATLLRLRRIQVTAPAANGSSPPAPRSAPDYRAVDEP